MSLSTQPPSHSSDKICRLCALAKPLDEFSPSHQRKPAGWCRECVRIRNRENHAIRREQHNAQMRAAYAVNRDARTAQNRARYAADPGRYRDTAQAWWEANKDRINAGRRQFTSVNTYRSWVARLKRYGITPEKYEELLAQQGGQCALCGTDDPGRAGRGDGQRVFPVDHCHSTGAVRGLLCHNCNRGLGFFRDHPEVLVAASTYVRRCCP